MNPLIPVTEYSLPAPVLQRVVDILSEMPSKATRGLLNEIEAHVSRQEGARREQAKEALSKDIEREVREKIKAEAEGKGDAKGGAPKTGDSGEQKPGGA